MQGVGRLCLLVILCAACCTYALPRRSHDTERGFTAIDRDEVKRLLEILRDNHINHLRQYQEEQEEEESEKIETEDENKEEEEENEEGKTKLVKLRNFYAKKREEQEAEVKEEHGGDKLDNFFNNPDPDSEMTNLFESMLIEHGQGSENAFHPKGIEAVAEKKSKTQGDKHDLHKLTHEQKVQNGLESEYDGEQKKRRKKRNFLTYGTLWENGIVPYEIHSSLSAASYTKTIEDSIKIMSDLTCVKFVPRGSSKASGLSHSSYIEFFSESGCWSYVGRVFSNKQQISLQAPGCVSIPTTIHEMCHAIGQMHEQSRSDRDNYVTMLWSNILGGTGNNNMAKDNTRDVNPYDHESVLQYSLTAFSTNGQPTMEFHDRNLDFLADSATGLMFYDAKDINDVYQCTASCSNPPTCQNGGFVNHLCVCYCPDGLTGSSCETPMTDNDCGGIITLSMLETKTIQSPNYPSNYPVGKSCVWLIKAPDTKHIRMTMVDLALSDSGNYCYHWLEVRYNLIGQNGPKRCGTVSNEIIDTSATGESNLMMLKFNSVYASDRTASKGFNLTVQAIGPGCSNNPCVMGTCNPTNDGGYTCQCDQGFTGNLCDVATVSAIFSCTFEGGSNCFMDNIQGDQFDWATTSGSTPSLGTGPSAAHEGNTYLYIETSSPRVQGDTAVFQNSLTLPNTARCLTFWYHMYGGNIGTLNVKANGSTIWTQSGDKGNTWLEAKLDLPGSDGLQLQFEGIRGASWNSDIAIDNVVLTPGGCSGTTTAAPTTAAPTTAAPTTAAPTTAAPTTAAPTTAAPTTAAPTTASPTTASPTTASPTTPAPTTAAPTTPAPTTPAPTTPAPTTAAPTTPAPTTQAPTTQAPTTAAPTSQSPSSLSCDFETVPCFMDDISGDDFDWTVRSGSTPSSGTGPSAAHGGQSYLYVEMSSPRAFGDRADFQTTSTLSATDRCLTFFYHMEGGSQVGYLYVKASGVDLWTMEGAQGDMWHEARVDIPANLGQEVTFSAVRKTSWQSDIAIDDVVLMDGPCSQLPATTPVPPPTANPDGSYSCTFEDNTSCFLSDDNSAEFTWTKKSGSTPSSNTGPSVAFEGSYYSYIEASSPRVMGDTAILKSPVLPDNDFCLQFEYHMFGAGMGELYIYDDQYNMYWDAAGDQGEMWHSTAVFIPAMSNSYIMIEGVRGDTFTSDIAIDNVHLIPGDCGCLSNPCQNNAVCNSFPNGSYACTCATGFGGDNCDTIIGGDAKCTFEPGETCFLSQENDFDDFDWTETSDATPSSNTGPSSAFEGSSYTFIETSSPRTSGDIARLVSTINFGDGQRCISFQHNMNGDGIGALRVFEEENGFENELFSDTGNKGDSWIGVGIDVATLMNKRLIFEGERGSSYKGDIALDDVQILSGTCGCMAFPCKHGASCIPDATVVGYTCACANGYSGPTCETIDSASTICNFEGPCFLQDSVNDDFDWSTRSGSTPSSSTGPSASHDGQYAYIEGSSPRANGDVAILTSEGVSFNDNDLCLSFWYHMLGNGIGTLRVNSGVTGATTERWSLAGDQGDQWTFVEVNIPGIAGNVIEMEAVRGANYKSDIAVDDVTVGQGQCAGITK